MSEELLKALANPTNQAILSLLAVEPSYPRSVSERLGISESDASRRLRRLEEAGLVASGWEHVDGRNVKTYRLVADEVRVRIAGRGLAVETSGGEDGEGGEAVVDRLRASVPEPEGFVGRGPEIEALEGPEPVVLVEGIAGIGKTSLAAAWAGRLPEETPVFFHTFTGTESLTWLAHRLGVFRARQGDRELLEAVEGGAPLADQRELALEALDREGAVTVLDAVEQVRDEDLRALVADAVERVGEGRLVVAGRRLPRVDPTAEGVRRLKLGGLSSEDVGRLLAERGHEVDEATADRVRERLGGHPLAIHLLVEAAGEADAPLDEVLADAPERGIEDYLLEEVHERLSDPERRALAYASVFHGTFTSDDLDAITPRDPGGAIVKLRRRRLLKDTGEGYRLHGLLRAFFHDRLEDPEPVHEQAAEHALEKGTLEARLDALYHLLEAGDRRRVLGLLERDLDLAEFDLVEEGYHNLYLDVLQRLEPDRIVDEERAGLVQDELGDVRYHRGEHAQALEHYRRAAGHFEETGAGDRLADLAWKRALVLAEMGREEPAAERVRAGLAEHEPDERTRERLAELADELGVEASS